jgi:hypothetical protein
MDAASLGCGPRKFGDDEILQACVEGFLKLLTKNIT